MTQTVQHMTSKDLEVHVSADGGEWTDVSGTAASWSPAGGERETGFAHTAGDADPVVGIGPKAPASGTLTVVYTEQTNEDADLLDGYYEAGTYMYLRARPRGSTVAYWQWTSKGYFTGPTVPVADASSGDVLTVDVPWHGTPWTQSAQVS